MNSSLLLLLKIACFVYIIYIASKLLIRYTIEINRKSVKFTYLTDPETGIQYIISETGGICPRFKLDGSFMTEREDENSYYD